MLPRHARRILLSSSTPAHIRTALTSSRSSVKSLKYRPQVASVIQSSVVSFVFKKREWASKVAIPDIRGSVKGRTEEESGVAG
ncbi:hypothetical protein QCA50_010673 [Cerrena zonata]|uniref:Uncharacterized protein n=1 Tax=Cerrena zonata TaxID=2478898 RepID=A0AAW0G524_9APHY